MGFVRDKRAKIDLKLSVSVRFAWYLRNCGSYHQDFDNDISRCFSLYFLKKCNILNITIILFLLAHFNSFFNNNLFFKFINKCQKEILRCAPPSSHVCDFLVYYLIHMNIYTLNLPVCNSGHCTYVMGLCIFFFILWDLIDRVDFNFQRTAFQSNLLLIGF